MDKSKMAKAGVSHEYEMWKFDEGLPKLSRGIKTQCHCQGECYCKMMEGGDGECCEDRAHLTGTTADPLSDHNPGLGGKMKY